MFMSARTNSHRDEFLNRMSSTGNEIPSQQNADCYPTRSTSSKEFLCYVDILFSF